MFSITTAIKSRMGPTSPTYKSSSKVQFNLKGKIHKNICTFLYFINLATRLFSQIFPKRIVIL